MSKYILLQNNKDESDENKLIFEIPEELRNLFTLSLQMLTNVTLSHKVMDKFFQALPTIAKAIRAETLDIIDSKELEFEKTRILEIMSKRLFDLSTIYLVKPYKMTEDMTSYNDILIEQFKCVIKGGGAALRYGANNNTIKVINLLRSSENVVDVISSSKLKLRVDRTSYSKFKLKVANDFYLTVPMWDELSDDYSFRNRKLFSGIRGLLYFLKDIKTPNIKKKSTFFTTGGYFVDALYIVQAHIDTFIEVLESDCFKARELNKEQLKVVQEKLDILELKYSFVLNKLKTLYDFELTDHLKEIEKTSLINSQINDGVKVTKSIQTEFDYQLNSIGQDFAVCRVTPYNFNLLLKLSLIEYINKKTEQLRVERRKCRKLRQFTQLNCFIATSSFIDIPVNIRLIPFDDASLPDLTIEGLVEEYFPEFLNNPNLANILLNSFIFGQQDVAKFKVVQKTDPDNETLYIYLYSFPNEVLAQSL